MKSQSITQNKRTSKKQEPIQQQQEFDEDVTKTLLQMKLQTTNRYKKYVKTTKLKFPAELFKTQALKAIKALKKHTAVQMKRRKQLLESEDQNFIYLNITMSQLPSVPPAPCGIGVPLPHPIYGQKYQTRACLFMKDPIERKMKQEIIQSAPEGFAKIMGYRKLMKNYNQYKEKRQLLQSYDLFFSDIRVFKMLPKCLGKTFLSSKKWPNPIKLHKSTSQFKGQNWNIGEALKDCFSKTYFQLGNGPNYSLKVARVSMKNSQCLQNVMIAIYRAIPHILVRGEGIKHNRVQVISLKTKDSIQLPIYNQLLKEELEAYREYMMIQKEKQMNEQQQQKKLDSQSNKSKSDNDQDSSDDNDGDNSDQQFYIQEKPRHLKLRKSKDVRAKEKQTDKKVNIIKKKKRSKSNDMA